jgi:hypothetical protein
VHTGTVPYLAALRIQLWGFTCWPLVVQRHSSFSAALSAVPHRR